MKLAVMKELATDARPLDQVNRTACRLALLHHSKASTRDSKSMSQTLSSAVIPLVRNTVKQYWNLAPR